MNTKVLQHKIHKYKWKLKYTTDLNKAYLYHKKLGYYNMLGQRGGCDGKQSFSLQTPYIVKKNLNSSSQHGGTFEKQLRDCTTDIKNYDASIVKLNKQIAANNAEYNKHTQSYYECWNINKKCEALLKTCNLKASPQSGGNEKELRNKILKCNDMKKKYETIFNEKKQELLKSEIALKDTEQKFKICLNSAEKCEKLAEPCKKKAAADYIKHVIKTYNVVSVVKDSALVVTEEAFINRLTEDKQVAGLRNLQDKYKKKYNYAYKMKLGNDALILINKLYIIPMQQWAKNPSDILKEINNNLIRGTFRSGMLKRRF